MKPTVCYHKQIQIQATHPIIIMPFSFILWQLLTHEPFSYAIDQHMANKRMKKIGGYSNGISGGNNVHLIELYDITYCFINGRATMVCSVYQAKNSAQAIQDAFRFHFSSFALQVFAIFFFCYSYSMCCLLFWGYTHIVYEFTFALIFAIPFGVSLFSSSRFYFNSLLCVCIASDISFTLHFLSYIFFYCCFFMFLLSVLFVFYLCT